jgi:cytochrome c biogenesis protein CcmG, thiol:disulfide interchange protein DsbE
MGAAVLATVAIVAGVGACGSSSTGSATVDVKAQQAKYKHDLAGAPKPLAGLVAQQNQLLDGDQAAFDARLAELRGYPVVVNKWASWCGPCRSEFPYFQSLASKLGDHIAFLGVDSQDNDDAAKTFLGEYPVPYPSYADPDLKIADSLGVQVEFPSTIFVDSTGNVVHVSRGGYASEDDLAADIERYAN